MEIMQFIVQRFDIKKLRTGCNVKKCRKAPSKELLILEFNGNKPARKIASLYLCEKHCTKEAKSLSEEFKKTGAGKHIGGRIYNINLVTH